MLFIGQPATVYNRTVTNIENTMRAVRSCNKCFFVLQFIHYIILNVSAIQGVIIDVFLFFRCFIVFILLMSTILNSLCHDFMMSDSRRKNFR